MLIKLSDTISKIVHSDFEGQHVFGQSFKNTKLKTSHSHFLLKFSATILRLTNGAFCSIK